MRGWVVIGFLFLGGALAGSQGGSGAFAHDLPGDVVDVSSWEIVSGDFETKAARGAYRFYVNPRRQAIYQLMRYRVQLLAPEGDLQRQRGSSERVAFVRRPGAPEPMLCWEREPSSTVPAWREVQAGTEEYKLEMAMIMQVLAVHRAVRVGPTP
jgi:hypothetical protein